MKKSIQVLTLFLFLILIGQNSFAKPFVGKSNLAAIGSANPTAILTTLLISFVVGNVVSWTMGAYPQDFPTKPYTSEEADTIRDLTAEIQEYPEEAEIKTELGTIYFSHNDLDKAEEILQQAVEQNPADGETLAIYSANEAKQSGAMWDFTWGITKLSRLGDAVDGLNRAVELAPQSFIARLYRMNTLVGLENRKGSFHRIFEDEQWFQEQNRQNPDYLPNEVKLSFYSVLARAWETKSKLADDSKTATSSIRQAEIYRQLSTATIKN